MSFPIFDHKNADLPSIFEPAALLREARRQKNLATVDVPPVCILDPDGDILRRLRQSGEATRFDAWPWTMTRSTKTACINHACRTEDNRRCA